MRTYMCTYICIYTHICVYIYIYIYVLIIPKLGISESRCLGDFLRTWESRPVRPAVELKDYQRTARWALRKIAHTRGSDKREARPVTHVGFQKVTVC